MEDSRVSVNITEISILFLSHNYLPVAGKNNAMREFWEEHSRDASLEEVMLDYNAEELNKDEMPEILSIAPDFCDKDVVELGAGIGRFTSVIAASARSILAVDFMESFIEKNKEINKKFKNVDYHCIDVMGLELKKNSYDIVFSNWLFMYLENEDLEILLQRCLEWLREDGEMFCRESCFRSSGNMKRTTNPTKYRDPTYYNELFDSVVIPTVDKNGYYGFKINHSKHLESYLKIKQNEHQVAWSLQKVRKDTRIMKNAH